MYMLTHRAQACLCSCTGGLKLIRSVSSYRGGEISLPTFFNYQCATWGKSRLYATSFGSVSRSCLSFSRIELSTALHGKSSALNSRVGRIQRGGSTNNFEGVCVSEASPKVAEAVASGEGSTMAEDNAEDEEVKDRKGRVIIIAGPTGVGKTRLALALAKCLGGEIISADSVQVCANFPLPCFYTQYCPTSSCPERLEVCYWAWLQIWCQSLQFFLRFLIFSV